MMGGEALEGARTKNGTIIFSLFTIHFSLTFFGRFAK